MSYFKWSEFIENFELLAPSSSVHEIVSTSKSASEYKIEIDVPGFKKSDINITLDKNVLSIKCKSEVKKRTVEKSFVLNDSVDTSKISATCVDGVLTVTLPRRVTHDSTARKIEIS